MFSARRSHSEHLHVTVVLVELEGTLLIDEPHRACMASTTLADGCVLGSMYLHDSEGPSPQNLALLEDMASILATANGRWILGMDANMPPEVLEQTGWPQLVQGHIVHCGAPTCMNSNYDYFVIRSYLAVTPPPRLSRPGRPRNPQTSDASNGVDSGVTSFSSSGGA